MFVWVGYMHLKIDTNVLCIQHDTLYWMNLAGGFPRLADINFEVNSKLRAFPAAQLKLDPSCIRFEPFESNHIPNRFFLVC
jgi:hypothetical protein